MVEGTDMKLFGKAWNTDDFQSLGPKKAWRLANVFMAEFLGTGILVFLGCATVVGKLIVHEIDHLAICLAFSCAVGTAVMLFAHISGSHINPAVSIAAVICGQISAAMSLLYIVAQCAGAVFGYALVMLVNSNQDAFSPKSVHDAHLACCSAAPENSDPLRVVLSEAIATGILVLSVFSIWDKRNQDKHDSAPVKFAIVLLALAIPTAVYTGCSINPARSFGPSLLTGYWHTHWIYWVGPILGSVVVSVLYTVLFQPSRMAIESHSRTPHLGNEHLGHESVALKTRNHQDNEA